MILTRDKIIEEIKHKRIIISNLDEDNIGPASIDLTLSSEFRTFKDRDITLKEDVDYKDFSDLIEKATIHLNPGDFVLGITKEKITLPEDICGMLTGRSRFARLGLAVHVTASFVHPGVSNKQVLEIKNVGDTGLVLKPGLKICQLILMRTEGKSKYSGKFNNQVI